MYIPMTSVNYRNYNVSQSCSMSLCIYLCGSVLNRKPLHKTYPYTMHLDAI